MTIQADRLEGGTGHFPVQEGARLEAVHVPAPCATLCSGLSSGFRALCLLISPECVASISTGGCSARSFPHLGSCQSSAAAGSHPCCELGHPHLALSAAALAHAEALTLAFIICQSARA